MAAEKEKVLEKVRERLPETADAAMIDAVDRAEEYFLEQTRRGSVPARAFWLWVELAAAIISQDAGGEQRVSSVKRGDTTVQYQDGASGLTAFDSRFAAYRVGVLR